MTQIEELKRYSWHRPIAQSKPLCNEAEMPLLSSYILSDWRPRGALHSRRAGWAAVNH